MSIVEHAWGDGFAGSASGGDVWLVDDTEPARIDAVHDLLVGSDGPAADAAWIASVVEQASDAIAALERLDTSALDAAATATWADGVERLRREGHTATVTVADGTEIT